jgi:hypothetical protein
VTLYCSNCERERAPLPIKPCPSCYLVCQLIDQDGQVWQPNPPPTNHPQPPSKNRWWLSCLSISLGLLIIVVIGLTTIAALWNGSLPSGIAPNTTPLPETDTDGDIIGCPVNQGEPIEFVVININGKLTSRPYFLNEERKLIENRLPQVGNESRTYCFNPDSWREWIETPVEGESNRTMANALAQAISETQGLGYQWEQAILQAIKASVGQYYLVLPGRAGKEGGGSSHQPTSPSSQGGYQPTQSSFSGSATDTPPPPLEPEATPTLQFSPEQAEIVKITNLLIEAFGQETAQQYLNSGDQDAVFKFTGGVDVMEVLGQQSIGYIMAILSPGSVSVVPSSQGNYIIVSNTRTLDGRRVFKTGWIQNLDTVKSSGCSNDGTWNLANGAGEIHWGQQIPGENSNTWGQGPLGYEVPCKNSWIYPVDIENWSLPGAPMATIDLNPIVTAQAWAQNQPATSGSSDDEDTSDEPKPPSSTSTPEPSGISQLAFIDTIYSQGNQGDWYGAKCSFTSRPIASCNVGGSWYNVDFHISNNHLNLANGFWFSTQNTGCQETLPPGWYICNQ